MCRVLILTWTLLLCHVLPASAASPWLRQGHLRLHRCAPVAGWCGILRRPLDPSGAVPGSVDVYFEFYPHTAAVGSSSTLVAIEGGPGYPTTESREDFLALIAPMRGDHDVLLMDSRGTGLSGAIDCEPLQHADALTAQDIGRCGRELGERGRLYSTAQAADDLAALIDALGVRRIDLYGDSYGTYAAQVFARRHPERLRTLVLDGAYPLDGPDYPWYPHYAAAMRSKFDLVCARSSACRTLPGDAMAHVAPALALLRARPATVTTPDDAGRPVVLRADASALAIVMFGASPAYATLREADAAARAFAGGDERPLLRLMAESLTSVDSRSEDRSPVHFSAGLAAAVFCQDPRQVFDMNLPPDVRRAQRDEEFAQRRLMMPGVYAPFSLDEYLGMPLDYAFIDECIEWPAPQAGAPRLPLIDTAPPFPEVPVLVISGELDDMTSPADGAATAAQYPHARHVVIANGLHVNALPRARSRCGARLAREFMSQARLRDARCAGDVPPVRLVPVFARATATLPPARAERGHAAGDAALQTVSAALLTCEDVLTRALARGAGTWIGLRGGSFAVADAPRGYRLALHEVRWTEDLAVSGSIDWDGRDDLVRAGLRLQAADGTRGALRLRFPPDGRRGAASARGQWSGRRVRARVEF